VLLSPQCPNDSSWSPEGVVELIEHVSSHLAIDPDRIYLTGYSMGGYGTWATACYDPERFAAIAPLCGGGNVEQAERLKGLPIWAFHGDKDNVVPFEADQTMVNAVRKSGGDVTFTVYRGTGHGICDMTYRNSQVYDWLLAHRRRRSLGKEGVP
jgi:predicted peptidase